MGLLLGVFTSHCLYTNGSRSLSFPPLVTCARPRTWHRFWKLVLLLSRDRVYIASRKMLIEHATRIEYVSFLMLFWDKMKSFRSIVFTVRQDSFSFGLPTLQAQESFSPKYTFLAFLPLENHRRKSEQISICQLREDLNSY